MLTMAKLLDAGELLAAAQAETGLGDWGDPTLPERFALAVDRINQSGMDADGMAIAAKHCNLLLTTRLEFFEDRNRYPLADEVIDRPMFATGEPRSGTTLMHALMGADPASRALTFRDVAYPSPPPGVAGPDDPRREQADQDWREVNAVQKTWLKAHPYNDMLGDAPPECERTWSFDFRVMTPDCWLRMPMPTVIDLPSDDAAQYRIHKMMLQQFQYNLPKKRWVLKGFHGHRLPGLFDAYPDAKIVWLHRDPVQVAASFTWMVHHIYDGILEVDMKQTARMGIDRLRANVSNVLSNPMINDARIHHITFAEFMRDPVETIRSYYKFCDRELTSAGETAMRNYLKDNPGDRHGKFHYSTDVITDIGEDLDELSETARPYRERFGVPLEHRR
jgi:hypothetical protein